jgi:hypothetical protein
MAPEDRDRAIGGLRAFALAAGELPVLDLFGWADAVDEARSAPDG